MTAFILVLSLERNQNLKKVLFYSVSLRVYIWTNKMPHDVTLLWFFSTYIVVGWEKLLWHIFRPYLRMLSNGFKINWNFLKKIQIELN